MVDITQRDFDALCICAIRYCQGRQSYMPSLIRRIVEAHLGDVSDNGLRTLINDCDLQSEYQLFGDELIDKPGWIRWKDSLLEEKARRDMNEDQTLNGTDTNKNRTGGFVYGVN